MKKRRKNTSNIDYTKLTSIEVYDYLVAGKILKFPNGFVTPHNMKEIVREVVLNRLKLTREEICKKLSYIYLRKYKLGGSKRAFNSNIFNLITYCFPEMDIKYWELNKVENSFWEKEKNRKEFMLWLTQKENIDLTSIDDLRILDAKLIQKYGGSKALKFGGGVYSLILLVAEINVKEWQVVKMPVWTEAKVKDAVKWLIEEQLKWTHEEVVKNISAKVFYENNLGGLLSKYCDHSPIRALQIAYPGQYTKVRNSRLEYLKK